MKYLCRKLSPLNLRILITLAYNNNPSNIETKKIPSIRQKTLTRRRKTKTKRKAITKLFALHTNVENKKDKAKLFPFTQTQKKGKNQHEISYFIQPSQEEIDCFVHFIIY